MTTSASAESSKPSCQSLSFFYCVIQRESLLFSSCPRNYRARSGSEEGRQHEQSRPIKEREDARRPPPNPALPSRTQPSSLATCRITLLIVYQQASSPEPPPPSSMASAISDRLAQTQATAPLAFDSAILLLIRGTLVVGCSRFLRATLSPALRLVSREETLVQLQDEDEDEGT